MISWGLNKFTFENFEDSRRGDTEPAQLQSNMAAAGPAAPEPEQRFKVGQGGIPIGQLGCR